MYTTKPGASLFFPMLATPTGELLVPEHPPDTNRGLMMPTRRRTRAQDRAYRIALERQHTTPPASPANNSYSQNYSPETTSRRRSDG